MIGRLVRDFIDTLLLNIAGKWECDNTQKSSNTQEFRGSAFLGALSTSVFPRFGYRVHAS